MRNRGGGSLRPQQSLAAKQSPPFYLFVCTLSAFEFRYQLRGCCVPRVPQDGLDWDIRYCFALCDLRNFLANANAQIQHAMICLRSGLHRG